VVFAYFKDRVCVGLLELTWAHICARVVFAYFKTAYVLVSWN
jgi:hypothetical protein